jgi:tetratricopeptide (TPR) repeat protein
MPVDGGQRRRLLGGPPVGGAGGSGHIAAQYQPRGDREQRHGVGAVGAALDGTSLGEARRQLDELYDQHLITEPAPGRYQLHDLLREHARALATADDQADRDAAAGRVLDYYLHTALAADRYFDPRASAYRRPLPGNPPAHAPDLATYGQAAAWLDAERANLHAAVDYAVTGRRSRHAVVMPAAMSGFLAVRGHWDQSAALHQAALAAARQAGDQLGEADTITTLGALERNTGDYPAATASHQQALALFGDLGDLEGQAYALNCLGVDQEETGDYPAATASQHQALALFRGIGHRLGQAHALNDLGLIQQHTGNYPAAAASHQQALALFADLGNRLGQAEALNRLGELPPHLGTPGARRVEETLRHHPMTPQPGS